MNIHVLRAAYLAPALGDFYLAADTLFRITDGPVLPSYRFASAALCWGIFLLIGLWRPLDRAWILWPTAMVIALISLSAVAGYAAGEMSAARLTLALVLGASFVTLCFAGLSYARRAGADMAG